MPSYQRSNAPYLYRSRHGLFYFRIVVPEAIRPIIGKREIRRSLRTTSKREAVIRSSGLMVNIQSAFERAYQGEKLDTTNSPIGNISIPTGSNDFPSYQHASNQPVSLTQATAPPDPTNPPQDLPAPSQGPYLSEIIKEYRESQEREGVSLKTLDDKESVVRLLIRIVGDMPVSSFRHSVADHLKQKGVTEALIGGILGHTTGGITINRYGKDFKPSVLKPVIEQIEL